MAFLIGAALALSLGLFASFVGLDRDRGVYPTVMIFIASYYGLFAVMGGSTEALIIELMVGVVFLGASIAGFKRSLWIVVAALAAHGAFDLVHDHLIENPGAPSWWPPFCLAFDVGAAACLARLLLRSKNDATAS